MTVDQCSSDKVPLRGGVSYACYVLSVLSYSLLPFLMPRAYTIPQNLNLSSRETRRLLIRRACLSHVWISTRMESATLSTPHASGETRICRLISPPHSSTTF